MSEHRDSGPFGRAIRIGVALCVLAAGGALIYAATGSFPPAVAAPLATIALIVGLYVAGDAIYESWAWWRYYKALAEREIHEANERLWKEQAAQRRLWEIEDELGLDLDGDWVVGNPGRPRTNRYRPPQRGAPKVLVNDYRDPRIQAMHRILQFIERSWRLTVEAGENPATRAIGLARSNWCPASGAQDRERQEYEAILSLLSERPISLVAGRRRGVEGHFTVSSVDEAMEVVRSYWPYVNVPEVLTRGPMATHPTQVPQVVEE